MPRAGDVVSGKYRLIHPLGIGGMGTVWRAEHVALKQQVALKLLNARGAAAATVKRFQREAQIAASIRHRNIVYISDFGLDREEPYIVMELLTGVPLSERMVVGEPLSVVTFLHIVDETLQGLSAVHAAGVVHRDMKPENIFLVRESDGTMFPKLLDFGVSRSTERGRGHTITREGIVMGTPEYVSPEQARGRMADVRSDIYSLGVVIYEALAGRLPFHADNPADLIVAVLNAQALPLHTLRPELGHALSDFIMRAIEREPDMRFQSAEEMRLALLSLLAREQANFVGQQLPKRFVAPPAAHQEDNSLELAETGALPVRRFWTERVLKVGRGKGRWLLASAALITTVAFSQAFLGGRGNAHEQPKLRVASAAAPVHVEAPVVPPPPSDVTVELFGLPKDATVTADGRAVDGNALHFARDSGVHEIVVAAPGKQPFHVSHDAHVDGRYAIAMNPVKRGKVREASAPLLKKGLLRRPDF